MLNKNSIHRLFFASVAFVLTGFLLPFLLSLVLAGGWAIYFIGNVIPLAAAGALWSLSLTFLDSPARPGAKRLFLSGIVGGALCGLITMEVWLQLTHDPRANWQNAYRVGREASRWYGLLSGALCGGLCFRWFSEEEEKK